MKYIITLNGKRYEVEVEKGQATAVYTGEAAPVSPAPQPISQPQAQTAPAPAASAAPAGKGQPVSAPMPGTILEVRCQSNQKVKAGDILFILEAMKMENEITAPEDGTITAVCVNKNSTVETGTVLCTLE